MSRRKIHGAMVAALNEPDVKQKMSEVGFEIVANTPEQFQVFLAQELARWKGVIEAGNITAD